MNDPATNVAVQPRSPSSARVRITRVKMLLRCYAALLFFALLWTGVPDAAEPYYAAFRAPSVLVAAWGWYFVAGRFELLRRTQPSDPSPSKAAPYRNFVNADLWLYVLLACLAVGDVLYLALVQARTLGACPASPHCDAPGETLRYGMGVALHVLLFLCEVLLLVAAVVAGNAFARGPALPMPSFEGSQGAETPATAQGVDPAVRALGPVALPQAFRSGPWSRPPLYR